MSAPRLLNALGSLLQSWIIGRGTAGVRLKAVAGVLQVRNVADTTDAPMTVGTAVAAGQAVTKAQFDAAVAGAVDIEQVTFTEVAAPAASPNEAIDYAYDDTGVTVRRVRFPTNIVEIARDIAAVPLTQTFATADPTHSARTATALASVVDTRYEYLPNVLAATTTAKATQYDLSLGAGAMIGIVQPDVPRNLVLTITDANTSISAFQIDVVGTAPDGTAATEQFLFAGGLVQTGSVIFLTVTSITVTSITGHGAGDVLDVGHGVKIGVTVPADSTGLTITKLKVDGTIEAASATDAANRSYTATTAPNGTRDYEVWYTFSNPSRAKINALIVDLADTATFLNSFVDALQAGARIS